MPTATITAPSILTASDFDDVAKYVVVRAVPLFDVHDHPRKGNVDIRLLRLLVRNSNERVRDGHPPAILIGHSDDDSPEHQQPIVAGIATDFRIADYAGRPTIFADFRIARRHLAFASTFPFRSIERIASKEDSWNAIVAVALLRREPDRLLGFTRWPNL
jgi:hypothetical protein